MLFVCFQKVYFRHIQTLKPHGGLEHDKLLHGWLNVCMYVCMYTYAFYLPIPTLE